MRTFFGTLLLAFGVVSSTLLAGPSPELIARSEALAAFLVGRSAVADSESSDDPVTRRLVAVRLMIAARARQAIDGEKVGNRALYDRLEQEVWLLQGSAGASTFASEEFYSLVEAISFHVIAHLYYPGGKEASTSQFGDELYRSLSLYAAPGDIALLKKAFKK